MHCQKSGLDRQTSAVVRYQLWFGAAPLRLTFFLTCNFLFTNLAVLAGQDKHQIPRSSPIKSVPASFL